MRVFDPQAPEDCDTAARWLLDQAQAMFGTARLAIGGVSAGATLAMTTLLRLRDRGVVTRSPALHCSTEPMHPTAMAAAALRGIESWLADRLLDA